MNSSTAEPSQVQHWEPRPFLKLQQECTGTGQEGVLNTGGCQSTAGICAEAALLESSELRQLLSWSCTMSALGPCESRARSSLRGEPHLTPARWEWPGAR